jgi:hypothetical protein
MYACFTVKATDVEIDISSAFGVRLTACEFYCHDFLVISDFDGSLWDW